MRHRDIVLSVGDVHHDHCVSRLMAQSDASLSVVQYGSPVHGPLAHVLTTIENRRQ